MGEKEKKKRRPGRRAYLNDFKPTASGEYVYEGKMHPYQGEVPWKKAMAILWVLAVLCLGAGIAAGCIPAAGTTNCAYVILPYAAAVGAAVSVVWLMARLTAGGEALRDYIYKKTVTQFKLRGWVTAALAGVTVLCEILFLILNGAGDRVGDTAVFFLCTLLELVSVIIWMWFFQRLKWAE